MLRTRRLGICAFILGCGFVFGAWLCMGDTWIELRKMVVQYPALSFLDGKCNSLAELLIGNAIGAYSVCFGFYVEYFGEKRELGEKLIEVYQNLRRRCFEKIFCKENGYDSEDDEVAEILEYISDNMYLITNYRPLILIIKVRIKKLFIRIREIITGKEYRNSYHDDNVHSLIATVILDIYRYFMFISTEQAWIKEAEIGMEICRDKIKSAEIDQIQKEQFKVYYVQMRHQKKAHMNRLVSRFPHNSKQGIFFMNKYEVYRKIYAINCKLSSYLASPLALDYLFMVLPDHYIVKDKEILYDVTDSEIEELLIGDEFNKELESLEID